MEIEDYCIEIYKAKQAGDLPDYRWFIANTVSESEMLPKSYSSAGAIGLNQLMKSTAIWVNESLLSIYEDVNLWEVKNNTKTAIRYWIFLRRYLRKQIGRDPKPVEIAWAYNVGHNAALRAILSKDPETFLPKETIEHGKKVSFYKENYENKNYAVWYYEKFNKPNTVTHTNISTN
jgi:soluble lytic murein transglycosylase-like protein